MAKSSSAAGSKSVRNRKRVGNDGEGPTGKVGPGNPPEATRFKPGQSGNPNGRPRKERSLLKHLETELDAEIQITEGGSTVRLTKRQALAKSLVHNSLKGDHKALTALLRLLPPERHQDTEEFANVPLETVLRFLTRKGHADGGGEE